VKAVREEEVLNEVAQPRISTSLEYLKRHWLYIPMVNCIDNNDDQQTGN